MKRGINGQPIFLGDEDYKKYLHILGDVKADCGFQLYAYCLMENHLHLLIRVGSVEQGDGSLREPSPRDGITTGLEAIFKRVGVRYVQWFNKKYWRAGSLFQGRFRSEPVETSGYFLSMIRYIHQILVKTWLSEDVGGYAWSSYGEYIDGEFGETGDGSRREPSPCYCAAC